MPLRLNFKGSSEDTSSHHGLDKLIRTADTDVPHILSGARRNTYLVRALRLALPLVAVSLIIVMMVWSDKTQMTTPPPPRAELAPEIQGRNELLNPKFQSKDSDLQPYTITAQKAFQSEENLNIVILDQPTADINLKDGAWLAAKADKGEFDQVNQVLKLYGHVRLFHDDGYELTMNSLAISITAQEAVSVDPVQGHGPIGIIESEGLMADGAKGTISFTGKSQMTLHNR